MFSYNNQRDILVAMKTFPFCTLPAYETLLLFNLPGLLTLLTKMLSHCSIITLLCKESKAQPFNPLVD